MYRKYVKYPCLKPEGVNGSLFLLLLYTGIKDMLFFIQKSLERGFSQIMSFLDSSQKKEDRYVVLNT